MRKASESSANQRGLIRKKSSRELSALLASWRSDSGVIGGDSLVPSAVVGLAY